jgi:hypothetical protein
MYNNDRIMLCMTSPVNGPNFPLLAAGGDRSVYVKRQKPSYIHIQIKI